MDGFQVDIGELEHAANLVRELGRAFGASVSLKYSIAPGQVGNEELAEALAEFHNHSRHTTSALSADTAEAAVRLRDTATEYERHDRASAEFIVGPDID